MKTSDTEKLRMIRALYVVVYNSENSLLPMSTELFHTIGAILEGATLDELELHNVPKHRVVEAYADLTGK
jgi:hypothetical protein